MENFEECNEKVANQNQNEPYVLSCGENSTGSNQQGIEIYFETRQCFISQNSDSYEPQKNSLDNIEALGLQNLFEIHYKKEDQKDDCFSKLEQQKSSPQSRIDSDKELKPPDVQSQGQRPGPQPSDRKDFNTKNVIQGFTRHFQHHLAKLPKNQLEKTPTLAKFLSSQDPITSMAKFQTLFVVNQDDQEQAIQEKARTRLLILSFSLLEYEQTLIWDQKIKDQQSYLRFNKNLARLLTAQNELSNLK